MTALTIRRDRTPEVLRKLANTRVARRLLAIANALSGMSRKEAAQAVWRLGRRWFQKLYLARIMHQGADYRLAGIA
jgi:hypothetical protein